jgi:glycosyltransferase involved in cell wall biosynthesis
VRVDQYLPGFAPHDAIGNGTLQVRRVLRQAGFQSDIWAEHILGDHHRYARFYLDDHHNSPVGRVMMYHASTSSAMGDWCIERAKQGERLIGYYHNITPAEFFAPWEPHIATAMVSAREELARLAPYVEMCMCDSEYNEVELKEKGFKNTFVCPLPADLDAYHAPPDPDTLERLTERKQRSGTQWLFVGRVAPNKCQHDIIAAFAVYRRVFDPGAHLTLIGGATSLNYLHAMERMAADLDLGDSVEIHIEGVRDPELRAYWAVADVMVCMSEHEGYGVPLLEAMELGVPVVAYDSSAIGETLGGAGALLESKDPLLVAEVVAGIVADEGKRQALVKGGKERAKDFSLEKTSRRILSVMESYLTKISA